tara:strand:- start:154 stop:1182 length:1029 start_codon:yes stop_codon:yes gene_type:complete
MSNREAYADWHVKRSGRLPSKKSDARADSDGMREYSWFECVYCKGEVSILSEHLKKNKKTTIDAHLTTCPSFSGERPVKRGKSTIAHSTVSNSTALVVAHNNRDELAELKSEMEMVKKKMAESEHKVESQQKEIKGLQDKTGLYDSVLEAVMPSLHLPLTAPVEYAKITLREAAIKDIATNSLTVQATADVIPRDLHIAMIEQMDAMVASEKAHKEEFIQEYKKQMDEKTSELEKAISEKDAAYRKTMELQKAMEESATTMTSLSNRAARLQKERDVLDAKYKAALHGHEQAVRSHGKHGQSELSKLQQGQKRAMAMEAQTAAAVAFEREFAQKRSRQDSNA